MSFWKKLGKGLLKAAPIAANFIPMGGPLASAAIRGGIGAAAGAASGGGRGALIGGLMGAGTSAANSAIQGARGAGQAASAASGAAGGAPSASVTSGLPGMPGTNIGIPSISGLTGAGANVATGAANAATAGGGNPLANIGRRVGGQFLERVLNPDTMLEAARGVSSIGETQAHNRGVELDAMMTADQMRILQDRERRSDESDLPMKLAAARFRASGGAQDTGPVMSASGRELPTFAGIGLAPLTEADRESARVLEQQLMQRLQNPAQLRDYDSRMQPGRLEQFANFGGPIMSTIARARGGGQDTTNTVLQNYLDKLLNPGKDESKATPTPTPTTPSTLG